MTDSTFILVGGTPSGFYGLHVTPMYISMGRHVPEAKPFGRGISASERAERIRNNPLRAAAIVKGRQRLAKVSENLNKGFRPLSTLRLAAGLSQAELAEKMDMLQPNIARLEKSPGDPSMTTLQKMSVALGVTIDELVSAIEATKAAEANRG